MGLSILGLSVLGLGPLHIGGSFFVLPWPGHSEVSTPLRSDGASKAMHGVSLCRVNLRKREEW